MLMLFKLLSTCLFASYTRDITVLSANIWKVLKNDKVRGNQVYIIKIV